MPHAGLPTSPHICLAICPPCLIPLISNFSLDTSSVASGRPRTTFIPPLNSGSLSQASTLLTQEVPDTESRRTIINVGSGSVSGAYALRDYLSIRTTTGSISITVDPQAADPNYPKPAVFEAYATAGSIRIDFPTRGAIPDRVYEVTVHSDMGSISGTFIHGQHTSLSALSGSISATILPYSAGNRSALRTDTMSGQTAVTVLAPYEDPGTVMGSMESSHRSKSGSMKLVYPQEWEGTVEGRTVSGSLRMHGRDLEVVREDKGYVGNHVVARKGKRNSRMEFDVMSGSVTAQIGDP